MNYPPTEADTKLFPFFLIEAFVIQCNKLSIPITAVNLIKFRDKILEYPTGTKINAEIFKQILQDINTHKEND